MKARIRGLCLVVILASLLHAGSLEERARAFAWKATCDQADLDGFYEDFLCSRFKEEMSLEEFKAAVEKDRTYPYITPFGIFYDSFSMIDDTTAEVSFLRAARLPGEYFHAVAVLEGGEWMFYAFEDFISGSYLAKFDRLMYSLDWYYDTDNFYKSNRR